MSQDPFLSLSAAPDATPEIERANTIIYVLGTLMLLAILSATLVIAMMAGRAI